MKIAHYGSFVRSSNIFWLLVLMIIMLTIPSTAIAVNSITGDEVNDHRNNKLILDPAVPFNTIDVKTNQGIITLRGTLKNILAKKRATRITESMPGVQSVINSIEVVPLIDKSGSSLKEDIKKELIYDAATNGYEITVNANDDGRVILAGTVDSWAQRELVETVASSVNGVTAMTNNINIDQKSKHADNEIKNEIVKRLHWNTLIDDTSIKVNVTDGKVYLTGTVNSAAEKRRAAINASIGEVESVDDSSLEVEKWARNNNYVKGIYVQRPDDEVREAVKDTLNYNPRIYASNLDASVTDGIVTLGGIVDNIQAKNAAIHDAQHTVGVVSVNSLIKVRPLTKFSDYDIREQVREALLRNPYIESYKIDVSVNNKIVYLNGIVDTSFEKDVAENVIFHSSLVSEVHNNITVTYPDVKTYDPYIYEWSIYNTTRYNGTAFIGKSDTELKLDIENQLFWRPFIDSDDINVSVEGGIATLTGQVDSLREYEVAEENALEGGAVGVHNKIDIQSEQ